MLSFDMVWWMRKGGGESGRGRGKGAGAKGNSAGSLCWIKN